MTGPLVLGLAVLAAVGFGLLRWATDGRFADRRAAPPADSAWARIAAALPDARAGERATLVQFSSAFCAPCRATRVVLAEVADAEDGVRHLEVDAEAHLELVRALDVRRTPTTLVLDEAGREVVRATGAPRREQVVRALPEAVGG